MTQSEMLELNLRSRDTTSDDTRFFSLWYHWVVSHP